VPNAPAERALPTAVMPRCRASSTPRLIDSTIDVSGILDRPLSRTMTVENVAPSHAIADMRLRSAARRARDFARYFRPSLKRARGMPGAQCTRSLVCAGGSEYAHQYSQRRHRKHPAFPTQWFDGLLRALPGDRAVLSPSSARCVCIVAHLASASGCQDHTTSPYAQARSSAVPTASIASPPRVS